MFSPEMGLLVGQLRAQNENYADAIASLNQANATIEFLNDHVRVQADQIADLQRQLAIAHAESHARMAQVTAMNQAHPDSPLLKDSGHRFRSPRFAGRMKTVLRRIYEHAFDSDADKAGLHNPSSIRLD